MKKHVFGKKLGRSRSARKALFRSLIKSLVKNGKIKTTKAKAVVTKQRYEKIMRLVSKGGVNARRAVLQELGNDRQTAKVLFEKSGFVKLTLLPKRKGDNADMALIELWEPKLKNENLSNKSKGY